MADSDQSDWTPVGDPQGSPSIASRLLATDAALQTKLPDWPTGGSARQIQVESGFNNDAVSPKKAQGIAQFEPSTFNSVAAQMGRKMDIHNIQDQLDAHQYLMLQNASRYGNAADTLSAYNSGTDPSKWDNPETTNYRASILGSHQGVQPMAVGDANEGWSPVGPQTTASNPVPDDHSDNDGWQPVGKAAASDDGFHPLDYLGDKMSGIAQVGAAMGTGAFGMAAGALHGAYDLATGSSYADANKDLHKEEDAVTYQPRTQTGKDMNQALGSAMDKYVTQPLEAGGREAVGAIPFIGQDLVKQGYDKPIAEIGTSLFENFAPVHGIFKGGKALLKGADKGIDAAGELDKLNADGSTNINHPDNADSTSRMGPNDGPQRPAFTSDSNGTTVDPTDNGRGAQMEAFRQNALRMEAEGQPGYGPQGTPNFDTMGPNDGPRPNLDTMGPNDGPQPAPNLDTMTPNAGPQRPAITVGANGVADTNLGNGTDRGYLQNQQSGIDQTQRMAQSGAPGFGPQPNLDTMGPNDGPVQRPTQAPNMGPNEGPPRPPISVGSDGVARDPLGNPHMQAFLDASDRQRAEGAPGYGPQIPGDMRPNEGPQLPGDMRANSGPSIKPDLLSQRRNEMFNQTAEQLDIFNDNQRPQGELRRGMSRDEFEQTMQDLASKDGNRFPLPDDMDKAYDQYLDMTHDGQGGLFEPKEVAENFAREAQKEALERRLADHPVVKANQNLVDRLQAQIEAAGGKATPAITRQLDAAKALLQKSKDNIGKVLGTPDKLLAPWEKDGEIHMFTFGHLPTLMKSLAAVLKGLHGLVFKTADRVLKRVGDLDSTGKILAQGVKDWVNKQATREWDTKVNEKPTAQLKGVAGLRQAVNEYLPDRDQNLSPEELKQRMQDAPDLSSGIRDKITNNVAQGGLQLTNLTRNPIIKHVTEAVDQAMRNAKQYVKNNLVGPDGLRTKMQSLSEDALTGIRSFMEINEGVKEYSDSELRSRGYDDKQIEYYKQSIAEDKAAFQRTNEARAAVPLPPIDRRIAHIAGYFMGDFKQLVFNAEGKVVAVLSHNFRPALETIAKRFMEDHGNALGYKLDDIKLNKLSEQKGNMDNRFQGYMEVLNTLEDSNADIGAVVDAYKNYMTKDAMAAMQNRVKFKSKEGVIGAEGRKAWQSAKKNAVDGARQQLRYLESINKWAEMQKAIQDTKGFLADPEIDKPNAKALASDYLDSVQGRNRGTMQKLMNGLLNGVAETTGVGPSILRGMNNTTKSLMLMKFVGVFKLSHSAVTLLQPMQAIPALNARLIGRGAELGSRSLTSVAKALSSSFDLFKNQHQGTPIADPFVKAAREYMDKNATDDVGMSTHLENVTAKSQTGENLRHIGELNVRIPEQGARTFTFMYYAHMLHELGLPPEQAFPTAHNLMRDAMVDYSPHERPLMFGKMGLLGDIASTLTRFKYNQIGQHMVGAADIQRGGSVAPLMTTLLTSMVAGGVRGLFGYEAINQVIDKASTILAKMGVIKQPTSLNELVLRSLHGMNRNLSDVLNFGGMSGFGVNMTGSLTNADSIPVDPLGALVPTGSEFSKLGEAAAGFVGHPNKFNGEKLATAVAPNSMKGMAENAFFTDDKGNYTNPNDMSLETRRSKSDQVMRDFSFRPMHEARDSLVASVAKNKDEQLSDVRQSMLNHMKSDMESNNMTLSADKASAYARRYVELGGSPQTFTGDITKFKGTDQNRDRLQRQEGIPQGSDIAAIRKYLRVQELK